MMTWICKRKTTVFFVSVVGMGIFFLLVSAGSSCATDLVFVGSPKGSVAEQKLLKTATDFYGLNLKVIIANSIADDFEISKAVQSKETVGVAVAADALAVVNQNSLRRSLRRMQGENIPLLILGIGMDVAPQMLKDWTNRQVLSCSRFTDLRNPQYIFGQVDGLTLQLTNLQIPGAFQNGFYLTPANDKVVQLVMGVRDAKQIFPLFMVANVQQEKTFLAVKTQSDSGSAASGSINVFLQTAAGIMFVKYCAKEHGWHMLNHYANFTIDDPWLRQPYGYLDYKSLLREMEVHNFHTTIAFIPWNYKRSEPGVVTLFRDHPERFSVSIHGNNHDHKEFTNYRNKPLDVQIGDLKQALARMEKFQALTGIPYDRVMIFPHSIAPESTLEALKTYNYLGTVNSSNVPEGSVRPSDSSFALRPITLSYAGFPSILRYSVVSAPLPKEFLAINEFLDNPLLFYAHSDFFANGINAFDVTADEVNKLEPDTQWRSLGKIVNHWYLFKLRDDDLNYDVFAFTNTVNLENPFGRDAIFYLQKREIGHQAIKSVAVDGHPYPYREENGYLNLSIAVPKGANRNVSIQYQNDLVLESIDPSSDSLVVYFLRLSSDCRDIFLAKSKLGLAFIHFYNDHGLKPWQVVGGLLVLLIIFVYVSFRLREYVGIKRPTLKSIGKCSPTD